MRRFQLIIAAFLEVLAIVLANAQGMVGVRTDEAKYLLNIPYPHPFVGRGLFHLFEWLPFQEAFLRVLMATLLIQAVWLIWDACRDLPSAERFAISASWVGSAALLTQAGTIMMAPLTALQALVFIWAERRIALLDQSRWALIARWLPWKKHSQEEKGATLSFFLALLWLLSLFTAFHIVLFLPVVWATFCRLRRPLGERLLYVLAPMALLALYTATQPLILVSFSIHSSKDSAIPLFSRLWSVIWLWLLAGSALGSVYALAGFFKRGSGALVLSAAFVALALFGAYYTYYAILFAPLSIGGLLAYFSSGGRLHKFPYTVILTACMGVLVAWTWPWSAFSWAGPVSTMLPKTASASTLIVGSYGHEWQYANTGAVLHFDPKFLPNASAVVCLSSCQQLVFPGFQKSVRAPKHFPGEVWVRK